MREKNLSFEAAISPRILEQKLTGQKLKSFSDISVRVVSQSDFEPRRAAGQIRFMLLSEAAWKPFSGPITTPLQFSDGILVHAWVGPLRGIPDAESRKGAARSNEAARALVGVLNGAGIESKTSFPIPELGPYAILVEVGPKPLPQEMQLKPENVPAGARGIKVWGNISEE